MWIVFYSRNLVTSPIWNTIRTLEIWQQSSGGTLEEIFGGDNRFYNNIFVIDGLEKYNNAKLPMHVDGNVYFNQAQSFLSEKYFVREQGFDPQISVIEKGENVYLHISFDQSLKGLPNKLITTDLALFLMTGI